MSPPILTELVFDQTLVPKEELNTVNQKMGREEVESKRRISEKDKLLSKRALQINALQGKSITGGKITQND